MHRGDCAGTGYGHGKRSLCAEGYDESPQDGSSILVSQISKSDGNSRAGAVKDRVRIVDEACSVIRDHLRIADIDKGEAVSWKLHTIKIQCEVI